MHNVQFKAFPKGSSFLKVVELLAMWLIFEPQTLRLYISREKVTEENSLKKEC